MTPLAWLGVFGTVMGLLGLVTSMGVFGVGGIGPARTKRGTKAKRPLVGALSVGLATGLASRWPAVGVLAGVGVATLPGMVGKTSARKAAEKTEAVAVWTELLRDTLASSSGLSQSIITSAKVAPAVIRDSVVILADRLLSGVAMVAALRSFADDVSDPSCDRVVCALLLVASARAQKLAALLGALAEATRQEVAMRLRVDASRASARSSVRTVAVFSVGFAGLLLLVARSYLAPFGSSSGQLVLLLIGACYGGGIALMVRLVRPRNPIRLLTANERP